MMKETILCETQEGRYVPMEGSRLQLRVSAYGILKNERNELLVIQAHLPLWEFPGGTPKPGETLLECLQREYIEETGILVKPVEPILERESFYCTPGGDAYHSFQHFFLVEHIGQAQAATAANRKKETWVVASELTERTMNKGAFEAFQALQNGAMFHFIEQ